MSLAIDSQITAQKLRPAIERLFELSAHKILAIEKSWDPGRGTPVFTRRGQYTSRGWTEWTQGFQFGSALLQYDATGDKRFLELGMKNTLRHMATHVSHIGVHDHGFNNISTYGNLWRLMREGRIEQDEKARWGYELALKVSGAIQAARWTSIAKGGGYIYSFNGPHSLFIDTMRSLRSLAVAHQLGHVLMGEHDQRISLLDRFIDHARTTAARAIYYGEGRDAYDVRGRTAHESIFNVNDGEYRCPNSQQGYSPFSTWTRGLAWAICGFAEQLEFLATLDQSQLKAPDLEVFEKAATAAADYYIELACRDGVPVWDTGAPNLHRLGDYSERPSDPFNPWEPVDSSAAAIAAQGLLRLGNFLMAGRKAKGGKRYRQAGMTIAATVFAEPYLSLKHGHQGVLLHSVYHRPNGWDHIPPGQKVPNGESSMWGDYHARELALMLLREARAEPYLRFFAQDQKD
jgi:unsaturated chondroitin disaccharide hydrolase